MKKVALLFLALFVFGCATTPITTQQLEQKTGSKVLAEQEIKDRLVGKALTGVFAEKGNLCQLYLSEDGKAKGSSTNTDSTGTWHIKTTEVGLPVLVMAWTSSWGTEKGTVVEKDGKISLVSQSGYPVYRDIK